LTSTSSLGSSAITIQFDLERNIDAAAGDVQAAINAAGGQLPANLPSPPSYRKVNPADAPIMLLSLSSESMPLTAVNDAADTILAQQLSQLRGVAQVIIFGQQKPAVRIQLDPARAAAFGLALEDVRLRIAGATVDAPKGTLDGPRQSFAVADNDQLLSAPAWNSVILAYRNGAPVRVRDIGRAVEGPENSKLAAWVNGKRCVFLALFKQPGSNVIDTVDRIRAALPNLQAKIPAAIDVRVLTDRTQTIRASVDNVEIDLVIIVVLVVAVIFVFLRSARATFIPGITVPLSLAGTFAAMFLLGYSLDNLSLMGLSIAVGFVVDDAIVMLENIVRHIEEGMAPAEAALKAAGEIGFTIVSISLSLVAVFIPLLLMGGIIGRLFREFAVTVTVAIAVSTCLALTLSPMMGARLLVSERDSEHGRLYRFLERRFDRLLAGYEWALQHVLRHQLLTLLVFLATLALTTALFIAIPKGFFPQQDTGFISGAAEGAQDISSAAMRTHLQAMARIVGQDPAVDNVAVSSGTAAFNTGNFNINLKPRAQREASADQVIARLRPKLAQVPGANLYMQVLQDIRVGGRPGRTQFQYTLQDANLDELDAWAPKVLAKLQ
ncbi:MAG TPA: efflux RND transporter permease subunit, partial [Telluria sp.]|nr:efflux RND transporter permease subunit [Telluria sp.]